MVKPQESLRWKTRDEFAPVLQLPVKFEIQRLRADLLGLEKSLKWDGLLSEYAGLCETHQQLPPFFMGDTKCDAPVELQPYQQMALSEFDESFSLEKRTERSGWFWDHTSPHRDPKADERFYRRPSRDLPPYLAELLDYFRPALHRARFAKLMPGKSVLPHVDYDTKYSCRLHVPIWTSPECKIGALHNGVAKEWHLPADGSVYFINQGLRHWATNPSAKPRVHLILSVDSQKFLEGGLELGVPTAQVENAVL